MVVVVEQGKEITQEQARHFRSADPLTFQGLVEEQEEEEEEEERQREWRKLGKSDEMRN